MKKQNWDIKNIQPAVSGDSILHNYMYKPSPNFHGTGPLFYGIELEVQNKKLHKQWCIAGEESGEDECFDTYGYLEGCRADRKSIDDTLFYNKFDQSIYIGFEIVSHPCSFAWIKENIERWGCVFNLKGKYTSYSNDDCGMHVHMSLAAFNSFQLYKFLHFIYTQKDFIYFISNSSEDRISIWANLDSCKHERIRTSKYKRATLDRHVAVCFTKYTVELRIFNGTLNINRYFSNIQFCDALFNFARVTSINNINSKNFIAYVNTKNSIYPNLNGIIQKYTNNTHISSI